EAGTPIQSPSAHGRLDFAVIDATGWGAEAMRSRLGDEAHRPFDLERDPFMRVRLFRDADGVTLLLTIHHIVSDHRSLQIMFEDLAALSAGTTLPSLAHDYGDFIRWQTETLAGPDGDGLWNYWRERLSGELPALNL